MSTIAFGEYEVCDFSMEYNPVHYQDNVLKTSVYAISDKL